MSFKYERFLIEAIEQCHLHKLLTCIKHGHNINIENDLGQNLLIHLLKQQQYQDPSLEKRRFQIFQFLITHCNLKVHSFDYHGKNVFNWATNLNCTQEALYLLQLYPGDINLLIRDQSGSCSLHYAIEHGNEILVHAIVDYLVQYRLRFDIKDAYNNTPEELARKLGYDHLSDYLGEACRSTIFMARELQFPQQRPLSNKSKTTINTKISTTTLSSSLSLLDPSEFYNLIESKIETAKNLNDWKTVAALRAYKRNAQGKKHNHIPVPTLRVNTATTLPLSSKLPPINVKQISGGQSAHMLRLIEPQVSLSYRRAFIPIYQRPIVPVLGHLPASIGQRKMSQVLARRMSSVMSMRKRDSNASQISVFTTHDGPNRSSMSSVHKQQRQSIAPGRSSDQDALIKLRAKHALTVHN